MCGVPVRCCLAPRKLAASSGTCRARHPNFLHELHLPRRGGSLPTRAPEPRIRSPGPSLPPLGSGACEPEAQSSAQPSSSPSRLGVSSLQVSRSPAPEGQTKLRLSDGGGGGVQIHNPCPISRSGKERAHKDAPIRGAPLNLGSATVGSREVGTDLPSRVSGTPVPYRAPPSDFS